MPVFGAMFLIVTLGSVGLPGLSGFVGEFLSLLGAWDAGRAVGVNVEYIHYPHVFTIVATTGVILGAVYLTYMFQKLMFGPLTNPKNQNLRDLSAREIVVFVPIVLGVFVLGMYPRPFLNAMEPAVDRMIARYTEKLREPTAEAHFIGGPPKKAEPPAATAPTTPPPAPPPAAPTPTPLPAPAPPPAANPNQPPVPAAPGAAL
jgi:NADH-quinone oxidoreductase subunit M